MSGFDPQRRRSIIGTSSRNSSPSSVGHPEAISSELKVGARAQVQGKIGQIRFVGTTSFQTGKWVGIELDEPQGKNSGVVQGKRYFECRASHGVFVRPSQVKVISDDMEETDTPMDLSPSVSDKARFAPAADPNLASARNIQQLMPSSSSSTLLPSRITSPSRISRLPLTGNKKPTTNTNISRKSASPTASVTATARKSKVITSPARPRSNTTTQRDMKENKLQQLRLQQQERLAILQQQQQEQEQLQQEEEEEEEAELQRQLQEEEDMAAADAAQLHLQQQQQQEEEEEETDDQSYDVESNDTLSDRGAGLVSTNSSTALPTRSQQQPSSYGSLAANLPISKSDQMIPLKDYEELRLKLKILESKRQEDRERYREHEKVKEEAEQFLTLRNKLQGKEKTKDFVFMSPSLTLFVQIKSLNYKENFEKQRDN